jgi:hypothetical protein
MNCEPFTCPVITNRFFAWCEVGACRASCCALSLALAPGPSQGRMFRGDSTRVSQLKLRGKATEPAQNPLMQIMIEVCNHAKSGSCFSPAAVVVDHVTGTLPTSARHQQTCNHASKQAEHQKYFHKALNQCTLCVHWWYAEVLKSANARPMGRLAFERARADGAAACIQVACSIYQCYTSRELVFSGYISKATILLVSESGASRKTKRGKVLMLDL